MAHRVLLALVLFWSQGCGRQVPPPSDMLENADEVLRLATERVQAVASLSADTRVSMYGPQGARKGRLILLAERPAKLHASVLSPTDDLLAVTVSDGARFSSFERGGEICLEGGSCPENVTRLLGVPLGGADLVSVLLGAPPRIGAITPTTGWDARVGAYRIDGLLAGQETQRSITLWIGHGDWTLRRITFDGSAPLPTGSRVEVTWEDLTEVSGHLVPHRVRMKVDKVGLDVQLRYRDVGLNEDLSEEAFRVPCPPGTRIQEVPCPEKLNQEDGTPTGIQTEGEPEPDSGQGDGG